MSTRTFSEHLAHLESLRDLKPGDRVVVELSGKTGTLLRRQKGKHGGWYVQWDEPVFGVTEGRVSVHMLARVEEQS